MKAVYINSGIMARAILTIFGIIEIHQVLIDLGAKFKINPTNCALRQLEIGVIKMFGLNDKGIFNLQDLLTFGLVNFSGSTEEMARSYFL